MKDWFKRNWAILLILIIAAMVMLPALDRPSLWQDEAETALLARSINEHGYPVAWNGTNLITQLSANDSNAHYTWAFTPWFPFYVTAASFKLLGESNVTGRLPFVLFGIAALAALYCFVLRVSRNRPVALLSAIFLLLNFQFIFYSRQCKYYSIFFLVPPILYLMWRKIHQETAAFFLFILCVVIAFYTNFVSLFLTLFGLILYTFIVKRTKRHIFSFIGCGLIAILFCFPFFFIGDLGTSSSLISRFPSIAEYVDKLVRHLWYFNNMVFGLVLFIPLLMFRARGYFNRNEKKFIDFLLWIIVPAWIVLPLFNQDVFRYNLHLIPLFAILSAFLVVGFFRWSKIWGVIFLVLFAVTNIFSNFPGILAQVGLKSFDVTFEDKTEWFVEKFNKDEYKTRTFFQKLDREIQELTWSKIMTHEVLKAEYAAYFNQLTTDFQDANIVVEDFFRGNALKGAKIYSNFSQLPLEFYLPELTFVNMVDPAELAIKKEPPLPRYMTSLDDVEWYFFRDVRMNISPYLTNEEFVEQMREKGKELIPYRLPVSELYWDIGWCQRYKPYINKLLWHDTRDIPDVTIYQVVPSSKR